jgi:hypothetical protein
VPATAAVATRPVNTTELDKSHCLMVIGATSLGLFSIVFVAVRQLL